MRAHKSVNMYKAIDRDAAAESDDPHAMILVLFDELLRRMQKFHGNVGSDGDQLSERNADYARSMAILHALQSCLDFDNGGEIAENLFRLYEYSRQQLLTSFQTKKAGNVEVAISSLSEIRNAWQIMDKS